MRRVVVELRQELANGLTVGETEPFQVDLDAIPVRDGDEVLFYVMHLSGQQMQNDDSIEYLMTDNPRAVTTEGIGPGSTLAAAEAVYGAATLGYNLETESRELLRFQDFPSTNYCMRPAVSSDDSGFAGISPR